MKEIVTKTQRMSLDNWGIVNCIVLDTCEINLDDAKENVAAVKTLGNGIPVPVYVDATRSKGISKEARQYLSSEEVAKYQCACAMLVSNSLSSLIGNFFLGLNKTKFPIRLFKNESDAKEWLKTFLP